MQEIHAIEKYDTEKWPDGPWMHEPTKLVWVDAETDLDCMIVRNNMGALCGYVGVSEEHPLFEKSYNDVYEKVDVDVHGSLTFADLCMEEGDPDMRICHVPEEGRPEKVWWLGFDCGHHFDFVPGMARLNIYSEGWHWTGPEATYRTIEYVKSEVTRLARQLASA